MDSTTLVILLISLAIAIIAGIVVLYKRKRDPDYIKDVKDHKQKPLMRNTENTQEFMGRHLSAIPYGLALVLFLVVLAKCGVA